MGGGDEIGNLVALTPEEHFVAHLLLCKMHPLNKRLSLAAWQMANTREGLHCGSRTFGRLRRDAAQAISQALKGRRKTPEHIENSVAPLRGRKLSAAHNEACHAPLRGRKQTPEAIAARSAAMRGVPKAVRTCTNCGKVGGGVSMVRFHFDRCTKTPLLSSELIQ